MNLERMKEVFEDEAFVKELLTLETAQEVQEALSQKGVELTVEEIEQVADLLSRHQTRELSEKEEKILEGLNRYQAGELSEEELQEVAGGSVTLCIIVTSIFMALFGGGTGLYLGTGGRWQKDTAAEMNK